MVFPSFLFLGATLVIGCGDKGDDTGNTSDGGSADGGSADGGSADGGSSDGGGSDGGASDGGGSDGGAGDCTGTATGETADAFAYVAGTYTLTAQQYTGEEGGDPRFTVGQAYEFTIDDVGTITYQTDGGTLTCCWDDADFDVIYGTTGESDLNIVIAEADNSNCAVNWAQVSLTISRFTLMGPDFNQWFLY